MAGVQTMLDPVLVQPMLDTIARVVGCRAGCFAVHSWHGKQLQLDVLDEDFSGIVPRATLASALCAQVSEATGRAMESAAKCANEGGVVTVFFYVTDGGGLHFEMGV